MFRHKGVSRLGPGGSHRSGTIIVVTVLALVGLMAAAVLTIDLGQMLMLTSRAQSLADAAALAGAGDTITNHPDEVIARIGDLLAANTGTPTPRWTAEELSYYKVGDTIEGYGMVQYGEEAVQVTMHLDTSFLFGRLFGLGDSTITRSATALRHFGSGGNSVIFAIDSNPTHIGINFSGNNVRVDGRIHSNTGIDITGNKHQFTDRVEWVNRFRVQGSASIFDIGDFQSQVMPCPLVYTVQMFGTPTYTINGDYSVPSSGTVPPGTYRVRGNVHISGSAQMLNVTFIADGMITMSGSGHKYTPHRLGVFAYSLSTASGAICVTGADPGCYGTVYAPNGNVDFAASDMVIVNSSIVGQTIDMTGSDYTIRPTPGVGGGKTVCQLVR